MGKQTATIFPHRVPPSGALQHWRLVYMEPTFAKLEKFKSEGIILVARQRVGR